MPFHQGETYNLLFTLHQRRQMPACEVVYRIIERPGKTVFDCTRMSSSVKQLFLSMSLVRVLDCKCCAFDDDDETASAANFVSKVLFRLFLSSYLSSVALTISRHFFQVTREGIVTSEFRELTHTVATAVASNFLGSLIDRDFPPFTERRIMSISFHTLMQISPSGYFHTAPRQEEPCKS